MEELNSSELGTQDYWKETYKKEINNYDNNGDPGEIWFGECSTFKVIHYIADSDRPKTSKIIDLGCGNGFTLTELAGCNFTDLLGVDYCEEAITLSKRLSDVLYPNIKYKVLDITKDHVSYLGKFDIVHDKGTYDAICLNPDDPKKQREAYINNVLTLMEDDGLFIITSCNWSEMELLDQFEEKMKLKHVIPMPLYVFGGKAGTVVSSLVFEKK